MSTERGKCLVVPVYNEQENLKELHQRLTVVLDKETDNYEIIFVNDGSADCSLQIIREISLDDRRVKFIDFTRNFGHQIAITAGMDYSKGKAVVIMDGDLQDPPEVVPKLIAKRKEGFEVVYAVRRSRASEKFFKKITASLFYRLFSSMTNIGMPLDTGEFRLIDRKVLDNLKSLKEKNRFVRGLTSWVGYKQTGISYDRKGRKAGKTKYSFFRMIKFSVDGITSFSDLPLRLAAISGLVISLISFLTGIYYIFVKLFTDRLVHGWATLLVSILFLGGIQLIFLGVIGEYISRIYEEVKQRPLYIVREEKGFEER